jgi:hypothetical protein
MAQQQPPQAAAEQKTNDNAPRLNSNLSALAPA